MILAATPWTASAEDLRFNKLVIAGLVFGLGVSMLVSIVPLPDIVKQKEAVKPRLVELILPPPEPIKKAVVKVVPPKATPKPEPKTPPKVDKKEAPKAIVAQKKQTVKEAQEKAKLSGLLAFKDQLSAMREQADSATLKDTAALSQGAGEATQLQRSVITSKATSGRKANLNTANLSRETGGIALASRQTTVVELVEEEQAEATGAVRMVRPDVNGVRSIEEVRRVFDANKGAIFSIYNRALRKDPTLLGKMVLEIVIEPDGTVSACEVLTTELENQELVSRVMRRVQLFDFGEKDVAVTRIAYPVHFLPT